MKNPKKNVPVMPCCGTALIRLAVLSFVFVAFYATTCFAQANTNGLSARRESINFISQPSGYQMAGTLSFPPTKGRHPAIILIWGTGPHTRDQVISKFPMFKIMADYFNKNGYAVLRIDKRGFGKSEGPAGESETTTTTSDLASDIYSALQFLKKQPRIDTANIGLIGHSEGAWIAEMTALKDPDVKWLVLLGAHIISGEEVQTNQMCANLLRLGAKKEVVEKVRPQIKRYLDFIKSGYANDSVYYDIGKDFLLAHGVGEKDITHKFIDQLLDGFKTPWYRYFLAGVPGDLVKQLTIPVYFLYGEDDQNVSPDTNLPPLLDIINQSANKNFTITMLPGLDHFFEVKRGAGWTLSDKLCPSIYFWLKSLN